jgi:hypothetical protein
VFWENDRFGYHWNMKEIGRIEQPVMLIPRYMYGTKKAVIGRCRTIMRHLFKHGSLPPTFNADLIDVHSVEGQVLMEMEMYQAVREHFHLYCLAEAFSDSIPEEYKYPLYDPFREIVAESASQFPWSTLSLLCQGVMNSNKTPSERQLLLKALLRHWPAIQSAEDKMIYEGGILRNGKGEDENGYSLSATAYWLRVTQGRFFWGQIAKAGIDWTQIMHWRSMEHELDNVEEILKEAIRLNQLKIDTQGPGQHA